MKDSKIIVAGVSSAGKSTFISEYLLPELKLNGLSRVTDISVFFAGQLVLDFKLLDDGANQEENSFHLGSKPVSIIHYNSLVYFDQNPSSTSLDVLHEPLLRSLLGLDHNYKVYLCYTPDHILFDRIEKRVKVEPELLTNTLPYSKYETLRNLELVDQRQILLEFGQAFRARGNDVQIVFPGKGCITLLSWSEFTTGAQSERLETALS